MDAAEGEEAKPLVKSELTYTSWQASPEPSSVPVTWDYHVFLVHHPTTSVDVYDFDTSLSFPVGFARYYALAVRGDSAWADPDIDHAHLKAYLRARPRWFRLVPAEEYIRMFASSREHMVAQDGSWMAEPPGYPAIRSAMGDEDTLEEFLDFGVRGGGFGRVVDEEGFWEEFAGRGESEGEN